VTVLEASGLSKCYRGVSALSDCNLTIPAGHVVALVGPNGAGKSTLLNLAVGLRRPSAGRIRVLDGQIPGSPAALAGVGFVAQDAPMYQNMSVAGMLRMARNLNPVWDGAYAVRRIEDLGISLNVRVDALSGGRQAQLALAIALAKRPRLLILDEPLARLDPLARHEFLGVLMAAVAADGMSVIFSSHVLAELERISDYLVMVSRGRIQLAGRVDAVLAGHRVLTGPPEAVPGLAATLAPIRIAEAGAQAHLLVRTGGREEPVPPGFIAQPAVLEELVLAYLQEPGATLLPGPQLAASGASAR
jgi:ABC-2 type transport system ATP-binding protein